MIISMNGTLIEQAKAVVSVYDHGFLYGIGLFETFRTYGGRPFLLERHLERLEDGCRQLHIAIQLQEADIRARIAALLEVNRLEDAYIRLTVTAGTDILGLPAGDYEHPTVIIYVKPLPLPDDMLYEAGKPLQLLQTRRNTPEGSYRLKSLHYMNNYLAKIELQSLSATPTPTPMPTPMLTPSSTPTSASLASFVPGTYSPEGLMLTADGHLAEGIVSNVFFIKNGRLCTPSLETGILPGITRSRVLEIAACQGISTEEGLYRWGELLAADEVFITNSIQELVPISTLIDIDKFVTAVRRPAAQPLTQLLLQQYRKEANSPYES